MPRASASFDSIGSPSGGSRSSVSRHHWSSAESGIDIAFPNISSGGSSMPM